MLPEHVTVEESHIRVNPCTPKVTLISKRVVLKTNKFINTDAYHKRKDQVICEASSTQPVADSNV